MPDSLTTRMILHVPFNTNYPVPNCVDSELTEQEFFEHCFVKVDFDKEIRKIQESEGIFVDELRNYKIVERRKASEGEQYVDEADDGVPFLYEMSVVEKIKELRKNGNNLKAFNQWIAENENENGIYCIKGDAGTGKTTFLHYLEYIHRNDPIVWKIVDLEAAHTPVHFLSRRIAVEPFMRLDNKVIAALLSNIFQEFFYRNVSRNDVAGIARNLHSLYETYREKIKESFPNDEIQWFFEDSPLYNANLSDMTESALVGFAKKLDEIIRDYLKNNPSEQSLEILMNVYMTILRCTNPTKKYIIAFDNIERFIHHDEIYNAQIHEFIERLRHLLDSWRANDKEFLKKFQMIVLMRNTSSRMSSIPLQLVDFEGHELNLSGWFPMEKIVSQKLDWYQQHNLPVEQGGLIDSIIGKNSFDGDRHRSLQAKLSMLFNNNKRVTINMLDDAVDIARQHNPKIMRIFEQFRDNKRNIPPQLARFAARSIIIRIILDRLKDDKLFEYIGVQRAEIGDGTSVTKRDKLGYARKILTILHEYSLEKPDYMPFDRFVQQLNGNGQQRILEYFDSNNAVARETITKILFYMNYYNRRKNNWLHFIDIQCNKPGQPDGIIRISDESELKKMIDENHTIMGMRIMQAGIGYLYYFVQSFEYFACRVTDEYIPPLLCLIPTLEELRKSAVSEMRCVRAIKRVKKEAFDCLNLMSQRTDSFGSRDIPFRTSLNANFISHKDRIINAHTGYINNFIDCIVEYYENDLRITDTDKKKLRSLYDELESDIREYKNLKSKASFRGSN